MIYRRFLLEVEEKSSPVNIKKSNNLTNSNEEQSSDIETDQNNDDISDDMDTSEDSSEDPAEEDPVEEDPVEEDPVEEDPVEEDPESYLISYKKFFLIQKLNELKGRLEEKGLGISELNTILLFVSDLSYETLLLLTMRILTMVKNYIKESKNNDKIKTK